jgi:thioredoxin 1
MAVHRAPWWAAAGLLLALAAGAGLYQRTGQESAALQVAARPEASAVDPVLKALEAGKPAVIEFGANACVSCREMKPVLAALAQSHGDRITVADVDILKEREYISRYQIRLMPTQIFFDAQGQEIGRHMGKISGDEILARLGLPAAQP